MSDNKLVKSILDAATFTPVATSVMVNVFATLSRYML